MRQRQLFVGLGAAVLVTLVVWWSYRELARRREGALLPALPDLAASTPAVAEAVRAADAAARRDATSAEAVGRLGLTYHANLFTDAAAAAYARAAALAPDAWRWDYLLALTAEERGDVDRVVELLKGVLAREPSMAVGWYRLGDAEFKQSRFVDAARVFQHARDATGVYAPNIGEGSRTAPVTAYATLGLARIALERGDVQAARRELESVVVGDRAIGAGFGPAHRLLAQVAERLGDLAAADRHRLRADALGAYVPPADPFVDELTRASRHSTFLLKQATLATRARDTAWRQFVTTRAFDIDPGNPDVLFEMAALRQAEGRLDEALELYRRHEKLVPGEPQTQVQIGKCLTDLERWQEAEAVLTPVAADGDAVAAYNLGVVFDRQGRWEEARAHYERAIVLNPFYARAYNNLGVGLAQRGEVDVALGLYEEAARAAPGDADIENNRGVALASLGRLREATTHFKRALEIDPNHADARRNLDATSAAARAPR